MISLLYASVMMQAKITEIDLEEARFALNLQKQVFEQQGRKILVISNLTSMSKISKEARDLAKSPEGQKVDDYILAYALVAPNFLARMMGSMIMGLFKQAYPIKIFPNEEKAIEWLLAQRNG
ncbi:STAS/SEC14 domain-containing protein [Saprospira grandis]|nr:STAS/SEC14 domain-containing protein [Saprospira grandis]